MSVNVRWNGRGWPGKVPRSPVASPIGKGTRKMNWKNGRPKGTVKAVWQKTGMAIKKKKKKKWVFFMTSKLTATLFIKKQRKYYQYPACFFLLL
jgi:hypothetical protein